MKLNKNQRSAIKFFKMFFICIITNIICWLLVIPEVLTLFRFGWMKKVDKAGFKLFCEVED